MAETASTCWDEMDTRRWRFTFEYLLLNNVCSALGWRLSDPLKLHGFRWRARFGPARLQNVLRGESAVELLRKVEQAEVARRALRIEREVTGEQLAAAGFRLQDPRTGTWRAVHRTSKHVLEAPCAAELRRLLREYLSDAAHSQALGLEAPPLTADATVLEAAHG